MGYERIVVIGASAGGVRALQRLVARLAPEFPSPILIVQHIGSHPSVLPALLSRSGPLPASHARDGERIAAGRILVAPPDYHMLVEGEFIRLSHGPKEQYARPAIDPLFRSAAVSWGPGTIGVLLTGLLDDGTAGLQDIKRCGGSAVVQDPDEAQAPSMPLSALRYVAVDHRLAIDAMAPLLSRLVAEPVPQRAPVLQHRLVEENELLLGRGDFLAHLHSLGKPSSFVCPECEGTLWEMADAHPPRYRCHTGHGFTLRSLQHAQGESTDEALWAALRALQDKRMLLEALAQSEGEGGEPREGSTLREEARRAARYAEALRRLIEERPAPPE